MSVKKGAKLAAQLNISKSRGLEAVMKAQLISAILKSAKANRLTHAEIAKRSGLSRTSVTGILAGSLQRVTLNRILKLVEAAGLVAEIRVKRAA